MGSRRHRRSTTPPMCGSTTPSPMPSGTATRWAISSAFWPGALTSTAPAGRTRRTGTAGPAMATRSTTRGRRPGGSAPTTTRSGASMAAMATHMAPIAALRGLGHGTRAPAPMARAGAAWGPRGSAGFVAAYNPRTDGAGYLAGGRNVYGSWKSAGVRRGSDWARVTARDTAGGGSALRWNTSEGQGFLREGRRGDIYAGRDGNVYRNTGDGWQKFDGGWQDVARPERGELLQRGEGLEGLSAEGRERLQERGGNGRLGGLAGAGAAGAAGAALGQRLAAGGERTRGAGGSQDRPRDRAAQRAEQRPAAPQRPTAEQRPAGQARTSARQQEGAQQRAASRQGTSQQRPAAQGPPSRAAAAHAATAGDTASGPTSGSPPGTPGQPGAGRPGEEPRQSAADGGPAVRPAAAVLSSDCLLLITWRLRGRWPQLRRWARRVRRTGRASLKGRSVPHSTDWRVGVIWGDYFTGMGRAGAAAADAPLPLCSEACLDLTSVCARFERPYDARHSLRPVAPLYS